MTRLQTQSVEESGRPVEIHTPRFILKALTVDDATPRYSAWLDDQAVSSFIEGSRAVHGVEALRQYIGKYADRQDALFLGIFTRDGLDHIGNIKFEPINRLEKFAIMGILIGEQCWRGRGVGVEVIQHSVDWLNRHLGIEEIFLGVDRENVAAIRCYEKAGFSIANTERIPVDGLHKLSMRKYAGC